MRHLASANHLVCLTLGEGRIRSDGCLSLSIGNVLRLRPFPVLKGASRQTDRQEPLVVSSHRLRRGIDSPRSCATVLISDFSDIGIEHLCRNTVKHPHRPTIDGIAIVPSTGLVLLVIGHSHNHSRVLLAEGDILVIRLPTVLAVITLPDVGMGEGREID